MSRPACSASRTSALGSAAVQLGALVHPGPGSRQGFALGAVSPQHRWARGDTCGGHTRTHSSLALLGRSSRYRSLLCNLAGFAFMGRGWSRPAGSAAAAAGGGPLPLAAAAGAGRWAPSLQRRKMRRPTRPRPSRRRACGCSTSAATATAAACACSCRTTRCAACLAALPRCLPVAE